MINLKSLFKYSIPISLTVFFWLTMKTVTFHTGESISSYGFPFPWYASSTASSLAYDLAVGPFFIDMIFYILICHAIISLAMPKNIPSHKVSNVVSVLLWLAGLGSMIFTLIILSSNPHFIPWTLDGYFGENAKRSYHLLIGSGLLN